MIAANTALAPVVPARSSDVPISMRVGALRARQAAADLDQRRADGDLLPAGRARDQARGRRGRAVGWRARSRCPPSPRSAACSCRPAIYAWLNWHDPVGIRGWAIPSATDIAFALGVLSLFGDARAARAQGLPDGARHARRPRRDPHHRVVLHQLICRSPALLGAGAALVALIALNRLGVMRIAPYILVGTVLWVCVLKSGVHATLAGVVTALCIPRATRRSPTIRR